MKMWILLLFAIVITTIATWGVAVFVEAPQAQAQPAVQTSYGGLTGDNRQ